MKFKATLLSLALCIVPIANSNANAFSGLEKLINETKAHANLPSGTAIAVVKDDKIIYQGNFGFADIQKQQKVDEKTAFYIASVTKPYFALSMLLQEHQGLVSENTSLQTLFPNTQFNDFDAKAVTVKHLLSHTMGIDNEPLAMVSAYRGKHTLQERNQLVASSYLNQESPLNTFEYSNVGYNILSVWLDNSQNIWQDMMAKTLFQPLSAERTSAYMSDAEKHGWQVAKPYSIKALTHIPLYLEKQDSTMQSAGGMITSARDMADFLKVQLNGGMLNGKQVFPKAVIEKSHQVIAKTNDRYGEFKRKGYAWGWHTGPYLGETLYHHFGGYPGTHTHMSFMPEKGLGVVILNNEDMLSSRLTSAIAKTIYAQLLNKPDAVKAGHNDLIGLQKKVDGLKPQLVKEKEKIASRSWQLSIDKSHYVGTFHHAKYGNIAVRQNKQGQLIVEWGIMHAIATAFTKPDTIRVELIPNRGQVVKFDVANNKVTGLTFRGQHFNRL